MKILNKKHNTDSLNGNQIDVCRNNILKISSAGNDKKPWQVL